MRREPNARSRVALVTGATGAIGQAIARQIAAEAGHQVVLAVRNEEKARATVHDIKRATGNDHVRYELVDVSRYSSIRALAERWEGPLGVLVNNAASTPRSRQETPEGIELQFATNVLGYFWMTYEFTDTLKASAPARVVNVASYWAGNLDLDDLEFERRRYSNGTAYRQSKQANRILTVAFAERLAPYDVAVNACHPGDVNSKLSNNLGFGGHETPAEAARTPVWLATSPVGQEQTGKYFAHMREEHDRFSEDKQTIKELHQICLSYTPPA